jgi:TrmH family RNA methyltransferase
MKEIRLYSENNDFQHVETIKQNRSKRQKCREFFVEGVRSINQALAHHWPIQAFYSSVDSRLSEWARGVLARGAAERHFLLPGPLMEKLSDKHEPSELVALLAMPPDDLSRIPTREARRLVVLDRPANPGNLGTVIRSCDAFAVDGVVVTGHAVDLYDPRVIRATVGSFFALPVVRLPSQHELLPWIERLRQKLPELRIVGTSANAETSVRDYPFQNSCLLVFGNETLGLSAAYRELCDDVVRIPMAGTATSLNLSSAVSIVLYQAFARGS